MELFASPRPGRGTVLETSQSSAGVTRDTLEPQLILHWLFDIVPNYYDLGILLILQISSRGLCLPPPQATCRYCTADWALSRLQSWAGPPDITNKQLVSDPGQASAHDRPNVRTLSYLTQLQVQLVTNSSISNDLPNISGNVNLKISQFSRPEIYQM